MAKPLVVHTYRTRCTRAPSPKGFGDFLRGTLALHQMSRRHRFDLHVDFSSHPLANHIISRDPAPPVPQAEVHEFFNEDLAKLEPFLSGLQRDSVALVTSNGFPNHPIDPSSIAYLQQRIVPTPTIAKELADVRLSLGLRRYCCVHLRLGDQNFGAEDLRIPGLEEYIRKRLTPTWGRQILVLSDNKSIKARLSNLFSLPLIRTVPVHLGHCGTVDRPIDGARDAYMDFLLMCCATQIYQYSVYYWGSGFSAMAALISGRPLSAIDLPSSQ